LKKGLTTACVLSYRTLDKVTTLKYSITVVDELIYYMRMLTFQN